MDMATLLPMRGYRSECLPARALSRAPSTKFMWGSMLGYKKTDKQKRLKLSKNQAFMFFTWRRGWDSNPR